MEVNQLHPLFAAEIVGLDTSAPVTPQTIKAVEDTMAKYGVSIVRNASLKDEDHIRFSRAFGPLELPPGSSRRPGVAPQLYDVTNLDASGNIIPVTPNALSQARGFERFHTDSSFNTLPTKWSLLLGHIVPPEGANTDFIDTRIVYEDLPVATKARIADLVGIHDLFAGRERLGVTFGSEQMHKLYPPVTHPMVRISASGRKALYIGGHAVGIVGMPDEEARALLDELYAFATQDKYIYSHKWREADLIIWDNRCMLHRATPFDRARYKRDCRRTTINEYGEERTGFAHLQQAS